MQLRNIHAHTLDGESASAVGALKKISWRFCAVQSSVRLKLRQVNDYASLLRLYGAYELSLGDTGEDKRTRSGWRIRASTVWQWR